MVQLHEAAHNFGDLLPSWAGGNPEHMQEDGHRSIGAYRAAQQGANKLRYERRLAEAATADPAARLRTEKDRKPKCR